MESIKEIRTHIDSVQQTLKITNAMYLISSSKLRKARQQLTNIQPYFTKTKQTISDILHRTQDVEHVYFYRAGRAVKKEEKTAGRRCGSVETCRKVRGVATPYG